MRYHLIAFLSGYILDLIIGDPHMFPHPVRLIGTLISSLERRWNKGEGKARRRNGRMLVVTVVLLTIVISAGLLIGSYIINRYLGTVIEAVMTYQILSIKDLRVESMRVYKRLKVDDIEGARQAVAMIVGRDTADLSAEGVAKAAIETVAENTSDGGIAPMLYTALGGPILGFFYKSVNTMDSMIGYKSDRYMDFGRCAAKLDDVVNFLPSRFAAYLMIISCAWLGGDYDMKHAAYIHKRDSRKHSSPNSAQTESVCAGALGIRLAGDASYFGKIVHKPYIGDVVREVSYEDIKRANRLLYATALLCEVLCAAVMGLIVLL